jgi:hypothetical protein
MLERQAEIVSLKDFTGNAQKAAEARLLPRNEFGFYGN